MHDVINTLGSDDKCRKIDTENADKYSFTQYYSS